MKKFILVVAILAGMTSLSKGQSQPPYGMSPLEAYSLFYENYRTGDYEMALNFGKWMLEARPREIPGHSSFSLPTQFERMINVYTGLAEKERDPTRKLEHLQEALAIYELARETFSEEEIDLFRWIYRHGRFYQDHSDQLPNALENAYALYEEAFEMDKERFATMSDGYFARLLLSYYVASGDRDKALAFIEEVEPHATAGLAGDIRDARDRLFSNPEERVEFLEGQIAESDDPESILKELADLYDQLGNREKSVEMARRLYEMNPTFENTRRMADLALSNAQYRQAINYLEEALGKAPNENLRKSTGVDLSETWQNAGDLQASRRYARQVLGMDANYGPANLRMAAIYAAAVSQCTSGRRVERDDRTVYWLVLDYLEKAQQDPSTRNVATRQIQSYAPVMPTAEDKFFRGWESGQRLNIDGSVGECYSWISETTTVR